MPSSIYTRMHSQYKKGKDQKNSCNFEIISLKNHYLFMTLQDLINQLDVFAPFSLQESYDNSGIQVGSPEQEVSKGLVCLDVTIAVLKEAINKGCDVILSHHPLIFKGIKRLSGESETERIILEAIRKGVSIISIHTNLDNIYAGVNHELGERLGLDDLRILEPSKGLLKKLVTFCPVAHAEKVRAAIFEAGAGHIGDYDCCSFNLRGEGSFRAGESSNPFTGKINELHYEEEVRIETIFPSYLQRKILAAMMSSHPYEEVAYDIYPLDNTFEKSGNGITGNLIEPLAVNEFLEVVKKILNVPFIKHSSYQGKTISNVALCGGSGSFLLQQAIKSGAHAFITADVKYHQYFEAENKILLIDAGHYETEQFTKDLLHKFVKKKIANFALLISETVTNPVHYH